MIENTICLFTAFLGFFTLILLQIRNKSNPRINLFILLFFLLGNLRYLVHGIINNSFVYLYKDLFDILFIVNSWPLLYVNFSKLSKMETVTKKSDFLHLVIPNLLFILYILINQSFFLEYTASFKIGIVLVSIINLVYTVASFKLLNKKIWKQNDVISGFRKQQIITKKWTKLLFSIFIFMHFFLLIYILINFNPEGHLFFDEFLSVASLMWILLYGIILYSPEFLYSIDIFKQKVEEYKSHLYIFDHIWSLNSELISNQQDIQLQEKIGLKFKNYIFEIEHLALHTDLFLSPDFELSILAIKLGIPKSHLQYVFKYHCNISFGDFKKIIRIQKAIQYIEDGYLKSNTLDSLALQTGFTSYSSFFKSFKSIEGTSPQTYYSNQHPRVLLEQAKQAHSQ